ncbi:MAG: CotH kinase family protein, partial [Bacteroidales bacterium]|nr:CotH kinase family protein [Bacteroidales bacterium]
MYNTSSSAVDISGYYLTDNKDKPRKWQVPTGQSIGAGKFLLVYCDGEDVTGQAMHTNFKLSTGGDVLYMYSSSMLLLDSVNIKPIEADYTYGRLANGTGAWAALSRPTPGASNVSTTVKGLAPKPTFSINGGFYSKDQNVTLSSNLEGAVIRYTTDGSEPNENSPIYSGAIKAEKKSSESLISGYNRENKTQVQHYQWSSGDGILSQPSVYNWGEVEKGFVIKAKVFHPDYVPSVTACQTYFINMSRPSLPIVSVTVDKGSFFSADSGIYIQGTNGVKRGGDGDVKANWNHDDWERKVYVEYFDGNGNRQFGVNAGAKVMGAISRHSDLKSLNIIMRKKYEDGKIEYPIFGDEGLPTYESFILRNSGNDWEQGMFARDAVAQAIVRGQCDLETQAYQPVVMYLNGEYWSIINLRERYDKHYFGGYYDYVDEGNIDLLKINKEKNSFNAADGDSLRYEEMMAYLKVNSMEDAEKYEYVKNHYLDVDNMINYYIAQLFCQNTDWPDNNMRLWRPRTENGKFRFPWYDSDFGYGLWGGGASTNPFNNFYEKKKYAPVILFDYMMKNDDFKNEFIQRFYYMLNTVYDSDRSKGIINSIENQIANERSISDSKWQRSETARYSSYLVSSVRSFAESRVSNMRGFLNSRYGEKGSAKLTVNYTSSQGTVQLCGLNVTAGYSGAQYKSTPIRMTAIPKDGYKFVAWQTGNGQNLSSDMEYKLTITGDYTIKAVFESRSTESNLYINEFLTSNSTDLVN